MRTIHARYGLRSGPYGLAIINTMTTTLPDIPNTPVTIHTIRQCVRQGEKFAVLTAYDATTAGWISRGGVQVLLVGDSAAQMMLGFEQTIHAPLEFMLTITAAVKRGAPRCLVIGDMPFMSYQADDAEAIRNAGRFMTEGFADAVKIEVDDSYAPLVEKMARASIPVIAHIGWRPQRSVKVGVPVVAGRTEQSIEQLVNLATLMQASGAAMLLIEQSTAQASQRVVDSVKIPVIGCGAGPACHGHVVILHDWLGLTQWHPSFVQPITNGGQQLCELAQKWNQLVRSGDYLKHDHPYKMNTDLAQSTDDSHPGTPR